MLRGISDQAVRDNPECPRPLVGNGYLSVHRALGSVAVNRASLVQVQAWMGHSNIQTTARYLHAKSQANDAMLLAAAFAPSAPHELAQPS